MMRKFDQVSALATMLVSFYLFGAAFGLWPPPKPMPLSVGGFAFFGWGYNLWLRSTHPQPTR